MRFKMIALVLITPALMVGTMAAQGIVSGLSAVRKLNRLVCWGDNRDITQRSPSDQSVITPVINVNPWTSGEILFTRSLKS
jgi:hypothetical protein